MKDNQKLSVALHNIVNKSNFISFSNSRVTKIGDFEATQIVCPKPEILAKIKKCAKSMQKLYRVSLKKGDQRFKLVLDVYDDTL